MRWKLAHHWWGSNPRSLDYIPSSITRNVSDHQSKVSQIYLYQGLQTKKLYTKMTRIKNWICPMTAILIFTICGKMVSLTAWNTTEMDLAQNFYIETTNKVLFVKNAYRSLSRAIFQFLSWLLRGFLSTECLWNSCLQYMSKIIFSDWFESLGTRLSRSPLLPSGSSIM